MRTSIVLLALIWFMVDVDGAVLKRQQTGIERNAPCGNGIGTCAEGLCCSEWGWCGSTIDHCSGNCQPSFGTCYGQSPTPIAQANENCGPGKATCGGGLCCSQYGSCGPFDADPVRASYCGIGCQVGFGVCDSETPPTIRNLDQSCGNGIGSCGFGACCSANGECGYTSDHCADGCQSGFGNCNNPPATPIFTCSKPNGFLLTYDDGPAVLTDGLLDYLKSKNAKATFFMNGKNYKQYFSNGNLNTPFGILALASTVQRAANDGHQLCMHGFTHTDAITASERNFTYEITETTRVFAQALGRVPTCFRFPYGDFEDKHLRILGGMGITPILWDADPRDWENGDPQGGLTELQNTAPNPGSVSHIVLNHDVVNNTADFRPTRAVPKNLAELSVEYLQSKNFQFLTAADCVGDGQTPLYRNPTPNDLVCRPEGCFEN
ncbi:uncharacterized protein SPPG_09564 [Spizellomyces punctatus DAOM BR117]|uniref:NodB homology domain-containing protein n=1 Tax=Spizellomyces punctatus (strain DAOM BR117) TaxID=645134 RepID=A0A0L0H4Q4_SPIPD|nr:uncharacterized protein SPPG_09564 [Spizellomyces punctatus DAOM BR117]KNC95896.1 hypothetical protein SPPG_09564 [Spizellomyces punctatus DAOM BR117]|eukprot:XP_016603936.1 hypothetical protein SPPG_09564 [Spizellomyces punctatus DAOM BR117]